jgi:3-isopropylmalate/(R)-2-methylmalate dehydratase small subunit
MTPTDQPSGAWEEPLPTLIGYAWALGIVLTVADILPPRHVALPPPEACRHVLADIDPTWVARVRAGDVVIVEELHGSADAGRAVFAALRHTGIAAVVARRYDDGLEEAALTAGIVAVTLDAPSFIHTGDRVRIDLEAAKVVNLSSGDRAAIRNLDDARCAALRAMLRADGRA